MGIRQTYWCVTDWEGSRVLFRVGPLDENGQPVIGSPRYPAHEDYFIDVKDEDEAERLWQEYNDIQTSICPFN